MKIKTSKTMHVIYAKVIMEVKIIEIATQTIVGIIDHAHWKIFECKISIMRDIKEKKKFCF